MTNKHLLDMIIIECIFIENAIKYLHGFNQNL